MRRFLLSQSFQPCLQNLPSLQPCPFWRAARGAPLTLKGSHVIPQLHRLPAPSEQTHTPCPRLCSTTSPPTSSWLSPDPALALLPGLFPLTPHSSLLLVHPCSALLCPMSHGNTYQVCSSCSLSTCGVTQFILGVGLLEICARSFERCQIAPPRGSPPRGCSP